jgi:hypothetical protein
MIGACSPDGGRPAPVIRGPRFNSGESEIMETLTPDYGRRAPFIRATGPFQSYRFENGHG